MARSPLDQFLLGPQTGNIAQDLLGNPMLRMGMGLLAHRADRRVNPALAMLEGLGGAGTYMEELEKRKEAKELREGRRKMQEYMRGLAAPTAPPRPQMSPVPGAMTDPLSQQPVLPQSPLPPGGPAGPMDLLSGQAGPSQLEQMLGPQMATMVAGASEADPLRAAQLMVSARQAQQQNRFFGRVNPQMYEPDSLSRAAAVIEAGGTEEDAFKELTLINRFTEEEQKRAEEIGLEGVQAQQRAVNYMALARKWRDPEILRQARAGVLGKAQEYLVNFFGIEDGLTGLRKETERIQGSEVLSRLKLLTGPKSDFDVQFALRPFDETTADPQYLSARMRGLAKLAIAEMAFKRYDSAFRIRHQGYYNREAGESVYDAWARDGDAAVAAAMRDLGLQWNTELDADQYWEQMVVGGLGDATVEDATAPDPTAGVDLNLDEESAARYLELIEGGEVSDAELIPRPNTARMSGTQRARALREWREAVEAERQKRALQKLRQELSQ